MCDVALCPLGTRGKGTFRMYPLGRVPTHNIKGTSDFSCHRSDRCPMGAQQQSIDSTPRKILWTD